MLSYDGEPMEAIAYFLGFLGREILVCVDWESRSKESKLHSPNCL